MGLEKIDLRAFSEAVLGTSFLKPAFSDNIDLLKKRINIVLGGLNGANDE